MIIKSNKNGLLVVSMPTSMSAAGIEQGDSIILLPGCNYIHEISEKVSKRFREKLKFDFENGSLVEVMQTIKMSSGVKKEIPAIFKNLTTKEAKQMVTDTVNIDTLEFWMDNELRQEIRIVLQKQIDIVKVKED